MNKDLSPGTVALIGIPFDDNSSFMNGPALAPRRIRDVLYNGSSNLCSEIGIDLEDGTRFADLHDLAFHAQSSVFEQIETSVGKLIERGVHVLCLGGDHSITYPILKAHRNAYVHLTVLHLDAHPDLYDDFDRNRYSHACPFARIMEEGLADRLIQMGIRTMNPHQRKQADRFGVEVIEMRHGSCDTLPDISGPVYISLDMDVLDPAFAPGISHHEPGGMTTRQVIDLIHQLKAPVVGADIVEYNPVRDTADITAAAAAKFVKEIAGKMISSRDLL